MYAYKLSTHLKSMSRKMCAKCKRWDVTKANHQLGEWKLVFSSSAQRPKSFSKHDINAIKYVHAKPYVTICENKVEYSIYGVVCVGKVN